MAIAEMHGVVPLVEVESMDESGLRSLLRTARRLHREIDALIMRIGARADLLAAEGRSAPADELLLGDGEVRGFAARNEASRARTVAGIPALAESLAAGRVGVDHVDSIGRRLRHLTDHERSALDTDRISADAARLPADTFDAALKRLIDDVTADHGRRGSETKREASEFRHWFDRRTGMGAFCGRLDPERYEALTNAVDQHLSTLANRADDQVSKDANLAAEALVELVCSSGERGAHLPHIVVVTDHRTLAEGPHDRSICRTGDGHALHPQSVARLACEATVRRVTMGPDKPLGTGRRYRTATAEQWDAMRAMYSSCAWHGCDRPLSWCQIHHILEWENDGEGEMDNLLPLCSRHHHAVHDGGWSIRLKPDRSLDIWRPDGHLHATTDPPMADQMAAPFP